MAETLTTLKTRRSCRAYKPDHVEEEKLNASERRRKKSQRMWNDQIWPKDNICDCRAAPMGNTLIPCGTALFSSHPIEMPVDLCYNEL